MTFNPSWYRILAIGKTRKEWIKNGISLYLKRLPGLQVTELRDSTPKKEAEIIKSNIRFNEKVIALREGGELLASVSFAHRLKQFGSQRFVFVIGGANGLDTEIINLANWQLSLSAMTFPHEIAQLLLIEQLYRAQTILQKGPYHRGHKSS